MNLIWMVVKLSLQPGQVARLEPLAFTPPDNLDLPIKSDASVFGAREEAGVAGESPRTQRRNDDSHSRLATGQQCKPQHHRGELPYYSSSV